MKAITSYPKNFTNKEISLPIYPSLSESDQSYVIKAIKSSFINMVKFISEVSSNHNQDMSRMKDFIEVSAEIGCAE